MTEKIVFVWEGECQRPSKSKRTTTTMATGINGMNAIFLYFHFLILCDTSFVCIYCLCCAPTTSMCSPIFSFVVQLLLHRSSVCNEVGVCIFSSAPSNKLLLLLLVVDASSNTSIECSSPLNCISPFFLFDWRVRRPTLNYFFFISFIIIIIAWVVSFICLENWCSCGSQLGV